MVITLPGGANSSPKHIATAILQGADHNQLRAVETPAIRWRSNGMLPRELSHWQCTELAWPAVLRSDYAPSGTFRGDPSSSCDSGGPQRMAKKQSGRRVRRAPKTVLRLPDLDQAKSAVLNSLSSAGSTKAAVPNSTTR